MTEKKLSRRDAMKLLGAAIGAAALANLPSKWDKPELAQGVLPAHARQSAHVAAPVCAGPIVRTATVGTINNVGVFEGPFALNAPITAAEISACNPTLITWAWSGTASTSTAGNCAFAFVGGVGFAFGPNPQTSPLSVAFGGAGPYTEMQVASSGDGGVHPTWTVGTVTVTLS